MDALTILLFVALAAVIAVMMFGILTMARSGEENRKKSNKMMRWRIALQLVAVVLLAIMVFTRAG